MTNSYSNSFISKQTVRFFDTDAAGIVYFGAFAIYFDEGFHDALRSKGIGWTQHREEDFLLPIVEQNCRFFHPLRAHDEINVVMNISKIGNRSFTSSHEVYLVKEDGTDQICASGTISRVVVDYKNFQPKVIPTKLLEILKSFESNNIDN